MVARNTIDGWEHLTVNAAREYAQTHPSARILYLVCEPRLGGRVGVQGLCSVWISNLKRHEFRLYSLVVKLALTDSVGVAHQHLGRESQS